MKSGRGAAANLNKDNIDDQAARHKTAEEMVVKVGNNGSNAMDISDPPPLNEEIANRLLGLDPEQRTLIKTEDGAYVGGGGQMYMLDGK